MNFRNRFNVAIVLHIAATLCLILIKKIFTKYEVVFIDKGRYIFLNPHRITKTPTFYIPRT